MLNYPNNVQLAVEDMCRVYNTPEKRKYAANQARLHLSHNTKSDLYSQALAELFNSLNINTRIQEELYWPQKVRQIIYPKDLVLYCTGLSPFSFTLIRLLL